jgi:hypothetical protein
LDAILLTTKELCTVRERFSLIGGDELTVVASEHLEVIAVKA